MMCLQCLRHSLACTARRKRLGEKRQRVARKGKGKRIPWWVERVQQGMPKTGVEENISHRELKACCWGLVHDQGWSFQVRRTRGAMMLE